MEKDNGFSLKFSSKDEVFCKLEYSVNVISYGECRKGGLISPL